MRYSGPGLPQAARHQVVLQKQIESALKEFDFGFTDVQALCQGRPAGNCAPYFCNDCKGPFFREEIRIVGFRKCGETCLVSGFGNHQAVICTQTWVHVVRRRQHPAPGRKEKTVIPEMIIPIPNADIEGDPSVELFQLFLCIRTMLYNQVCNVNVSFAVIAAVTILESQQIHRR